MFDFELIWIVSLEIKVMLFQAYFLIKENIWKCLNALSFVQDLLVLSFEKRRKFTTSKTDVSRSWHCMF